jgi:hypothetical protein
MTNPEIVVVPKELYYHEVAYVRGLEAEVELLRKEVAKLRSELLQSQPIGPFQDQLS